MNKKIKKILVKKNNSKIVCLTAYSKNIAKILDNFCDIILVGDSMANVLYAHKNTDKITLENILQHTMSVKKGIRKSLLVVDMPSGSYKNLKVAKKNAEYIMKKTSCDAIKIESNNKNFKIIEQLVKSKIPVMGHIGFTPQFKKNFKVEGDTTKNISKLLKEALSIQKAGAFSIVLECLTPKAAKKITNKLSIPTIGIASSAFCDGQILVLDDLIGLNPIDVRFVKKYSNIRKEIKKAVFNYSQDVRQKKFPLKKHSY